ncbi:hypothetical protein D7V83_15760 [bacterium 0.1xD8-71]|nr:hypothetical protein D7V83_15760 [bacterium 0.1xD8-71]
MNRKKWAVSFIVLYVAVMLFIGAVVVIVDPYFHYHAPIKGLSYSLEDVFYVNDGVSKHFKYNAVITGTSMTRDFKTREADKLFDKEFVRLTYHGEGFKRIGNSLATAIDANENLDLVIWGVDTMWLIADENWEGYEEYPEYLFDDIWWNDTNYLYNKEIWWNDVIPEIIRTMKKEPADRFDDYTATNNSMGRENVLKQYERPAKGEKEAGQTETADLFNTMKESLDENVLSVIEDNPNVTFYIFFPPYSICWWDSLNQSGEDVLMRRIDMEQYVIEQMLRYDNVRLFSFFNNHELICNLNNYVDEAHYTGNISSQILIWMKEGEHELTEENYRNYLKDIRDFYSSYDYESIFK